MQGGEKNEGVAGDLLIWSSVSLCTGGGGTCKYFHCEGRVRVDSNSSDLGAAAAAVACSSRKKERETEPGRHSNSLKLIFKCLVDRASAIEVAAFAAAVATVSAGRGDEKGEC